MPRPAPPRRLPASFYPHASISVRQRLCLCMQEHVSFCEQLTTEAHVSLHLRCLCQTKNLRQADARETV